MLKEIFKDKEDRTRIIAAAIIICIAGLFGIVNMIIGKNSIDEVDANFRSYAATYYEKGFYSEIIKQEFDGNSNGLSAYQTNPIVLTAKEIFTGTNIDPNQFFKKNGRLCDLNNSIVSIYPKAPYGNTDYDITVSVSC